MGTNFACRACGGPLPERSGPGPRAAYCSVACRRTAEYARRRWDRQERRLATAERLAAAHADPRLGATLARLARERAARLRRLAGPRP